MSPYTKYYTYVSYNTWKEEIEPVEVSERTFRYTMENIRLNINFEMLNSAKSNFMYF